jgi:hypothetical protein
MGNIQADFGKQHNGSRPLLAMSPTNRYCHPSSKAEDFGLKSERDVIKSSSATGFGFFIQTPLGLSFPRFYRKELLNKIHFRFS